MCLFVKEIPVDKTSGLIVECNKYIWKETGMWITPYRRFVVPRNGFLLPRRKTKKDKFYYNDMINGGYIHAYHKNSPESYYDEYNCKPAYAFGVVAYGREDLACRALYIPACDTVSNGETETIIKSLMDGKRLDSGIIKGKLPILRTYL